MTVEIITENLLDVYKRLLQPGTMWHVDELMNERRLHPITETGEDLRKQWFHTADGEVYFLDSVKTPTLAITREAQNPVLQNIDDAFDQLILNENYRVLQADFKKALTAPDRVLIALPNLRLQGYGAEWRYLEIRTDDGFIETGKKYEAPNPEEQKVVTRFGYTSENLAMLRTSSQKIKETRLFFLNPDYVQKHAKKGAVARASLLCDFDSDSRFGAFGRSIYNRHCVRGVRRGVVAEGGAKKSKTWREKIKDLYCEHLPCAKRI